MRPHRTQIQPYGARLVYAHHRDQWASLARTYGLDQEPSGIGETTLAMDTRRPGVAHLVVWVDASLDDPHAIVRTIVHEAVHAGLMLLHHLGHKGGPEDEPTAYLIDWIAGWLLTQTPSPDESGSGKDDNHGEVAGGD